MKCENEDVWSRVKSRELRGFSVESFVNLEEIKLSKDMTNTNLEQVEINETFWDKLKTIIADALGKTEEVVEMAAEEIKPIEEEAPAEEVQVEVEMAEEEVPTEEEPVTSVTPEEIVEEVVAIVEETATDEAEKIKEYEDIIKALEAEVEAKAEEIETLKKENQKLSKMPSTEQIKVEASKTETKYSFMDFASGNIKLRK